MRTPTPILATLLLLTQAGPPAAAEEPRDLGVGVVQPAIDPARPLYFYLSVEPSSYPPEVAPSDSLTFRTGEHYIDIGTAPPWFIPETLKLDYDLLLLRATTVSRFWVEVVVNDSPERPRSFPRTAWLEREAVTFKPWSEFLLEVYGVEPLDAETNPLRSGPGEEFPDVGTSAGITFRVLAIRGSWAQVEGEDGNESSQPRGWIRWRQDDHLLVNYYLLS